MRWLARAFPVYVVLLMFFDRGFAWFHVPGTPLFLGEMVIGLGLLTVLAVPTGLGRIVSASPPLRNLATFMAWGSVLLAAAIATWGIDAVRDSALWYYGGAAFIVAVLFISRPSRRNEWTRSFGRAIPWLLLWYPPAVVLKEAFEALHVPDSSISVFSHRLGNMAVISAMAIAYLWLVDRDHRLFTPAQRAALTGLGTLGILAYGAQNRGGLVAAFVAFVLLVLVSRGASKVEVSIVAATTVVLIVALLVVFNVELEVGNNRTVSAEQLGQNIQSIRDINSGGERQTATTKWRLELWSRVIDDVATESPVSGFGPGPNIAARYKVAGTSETPLRNPHNSHVGVIARLGGVGGLLWALLWVSWFSEMLRHRRRMTRSDRTDESDFASWLMISAIAILVNSIFDPTLEGPQVGFVLWTLFGVGAATVVLERAGALPGPEVRSFDLGSVQTGSRGREAT